MRVRRRGQWWAARLMALLALFALLLSYARAHSLRDGEAWLAWAIHYDPTDVTGQRWQINTLTEALRFVRDDVAQAWERLRGAPPFTWLGGMLLNGWALLAGDSEVAMRLPLVWAGVLAIALALRLLTHPNKRLRWRAALPAGLAALIGLSLAQPAPAWREIMAALAERRAADQAALVAWEPHSPVAYYDRRTPIRVGVSVDVGWRDFNVDQLADLVARFDTYDQIWLLIDGREALVQALQTLMEADRSLVRTHSERWASFAAYRYQRREGGESSTPFRGEVIQTCVRL